MSSDDMTFWEQFLIIAPWHPFIMKTLLPGVALFMLSWIFFKPWIGKHLSRSTATLIRDIGLSSSLALLLATLLTGLFEMMWWWQTFDGLYVALERSGTLIATAIILAFVLITLRNSPAEQTAPTVVSPVSSWYRVTPLVLLWSSVGLTVAIASISISQASLPTGQTELQILGSDEYRNVDPGTVLHGAFEWSTHIPTLISLTCIWVLFVWGLQTISARADMSILKRQASGRLLGFLALCGLLLGLAATLIHLWFPAEWVTSIPEPAGNGTAWLYGHHNYGLIWFANDAGRLLQAVAIAMLLRLSIDSLRASRHAEPRTPQAVFYIPENSR